MFRIARTATIVLTVLASISPLLAIDPDRDFSGNWILDIAGSNTRAISAPRSRFLTVTQSEAAVQCSSAITDGSPLQWSYALDGSDTSYRIGEESYNSKIKWEGNALLVNTIVSGPKNYSMLDRWALSGDHNLLTIERQAQINGSENEGVIRYRREGSHSPAAAPATGSSHTPPSAPPPALQPAAQPASPEQIVVARGTRIPLSLRNALDTKHSHEGDRVYLDTLYPVVVNNKIVIPQGSYVIGTLTTVKPAGAVKGKGELYIRFDSLTLANGTTRDFRSRLASADSGKGTVDRKEGTITGERDKAGEAKSTAEGAGIGAGIGGLAGAAAGHPLSGVGIGAAAGAAVGLATALGRHHPDASLPRGTVVEMLLDRDLYYLPSELPGR